MPEPSPSGVNGRDSRGRFGAGNGFAVGNPHARRVAELRAAILAAVSAADLAAIMGAMVKQACDGDTLAARLVLERAAGRPELPIAIDGLADVALVKHVVTADADALL